MAINWVNVRARGRPASNSNPNVWLRVSKIKAGRGRHALNILIYDALMNAAGFNAGDRVRIAFDEIFVYLEKNPQHGWLLSPTVYKTT